MKKLFLLWLAAVWLGALPLPLYNVQTFTRSKRYCKVFDASLYCMRCTLEIPDINDTDAPDFFSFIPSQITDIIDQYRSCDPTSIADPDNDTPTADWYEEFSASLEYTTPTTYTLMGEDGGYTGGAHGFQGFWYRNYLKKSGKRLGYADLFKGDFNRTLTRIAERVYRRSAGLAPDAPLDGDEPGWFENRFVLPENFAITTQGLLMSYNVYEVTPHAVPPPEFLLPYSAVRSLIDPKGPLAFALDPEHPVAVEMQRQNMNLYLAVSKSGPHTLDVDATLLFEPGEEPSTIKDSWLTLQFPALSDSRSIRVRSVEEGDILKIYPAGSLLYHYGKKVRLPAAWLEAEMKIHDEAERESADNVRIHRLHLRLRLPKKRPFVIYVRVADLMDDGTIERMPEDGVSGQQGLPNRQVEWGQ